MGNYNEKQIERDERMMDELNKDPEYQEWLAEQEREHERLHQEYYDNIHYNIGQYCRTYRITVLKKPLKEVAKGATDQTLSHFEHGRSTNIVHLVRYFNACDNVNQQIDFMKGITELLIELRGL